MYVQLNKVESVFYIACVLDSVFVSFVPLLLSGELCYRL